MRTRVERRGRSRRDRRADGDRERLRVRALRIDECANREREHARRRRCPGDDAARGAEHQPRRQRHGLIDHVFGSESVAVSASECATPTVPGAADSGLTTSPGTTLIVNSRSADAWLHHGLSVGSSCIET